MIYTNENNVGTLENNADYAWCICTVNIYGEVIRKMGVVKRFKRIVMVGGTSRSSGSFETLYCYSIAFKALKKIIPVYLQTHPRLNF